MEVFEKLKSIGYSTEPWSSWEGDKDKFFITTGSGFGVGELNVAKKTVRPCHGYYGGYLKNIAKAIGYELIDDIKK